MENRNPNDNERNPQDRSQQPNSLNPQNASGQPGKEFGAQNESLKGQPHASAENTNQPGQQNQSGSNPSGQSNPNQQNQSNNPGAQSGGNRGLEQNDHTYEGENDVTHSPQKTGQPKNESSSSSDTFRGQSRVTPDSSLSDRNKESGAGSSQKQNDSNSGSSNSGSSSSGTSGRGSL